MSILTFVVIVIGLISIVRPKLAIVVIGASAAFQAATAYDNGIIRLWVYYGIALFVCSATVFRFMNSDVRVLEKCMQTMKPLIMVVVIIIGGAFLLPRAFIGTPVFLARGGMDYGSVDELYPLAFTVSNAAQSIYLIVNLLVLLFLILDTDELYFAKNLKRALIVFFSLGIGFLIWQALNLKYGIWFPESLVHGDNFDQAYQLSKLVLGNRMNGSFGEPADLGMFAGACLGYGLGSYLFMRQKIVGPIFIVGGIAAALLSGSTTAYVAMLGAIAAVLFCWKSIKIGLGEIIFACAVLCFLLYYVAQSSMVDSNFASLVLNKDQSGSFSNRLFSIKYSLDLFVQTHGLGVGLGSHRPSSMVALLIACLGIFSIPVLWFLFVSPFKLLKLENPLYRTLYCVYAAVCMSVLTSIPDFSQIIFVFITTCTLAVLLRSRIYPRPGTHFYPQPV